MRTILVAAVGALAVTSAHAGEDVTMKLGRFGLSAGGSFIEQQLILTNNTSQKIQVIGVNCGFFHGDQLVRAETSLVINVMPNSDAYTYTSVSTKLQADNAKCRIDRVQQ